MKKVGSREFKNRQGYYLGRVRKGETILVTARGKPVAKIVPVEGVTAARVTVEEKLRELAAQGHIRLARKRGFEAFDPVPSRGKLASQMIIEDRR